MSDTFVPFDKREEWKDITPIPQDDGEHPVVPIAYSTQFRQAHDYFRAIIQKNEISERALKLTEEVIELNSANYTAWEYRRECLFKLKKDLNKELEYVSNMIIENEKNYQVWYHRKAIIEALKKTDGELEFIQKMLDSDAKNYHAWAHRQWFIKEFNLWEGELEFCDAMLDKDFRNNSVWNHRFFVIENTSGLTTETRLKEAEYGFKRVAKAPNNESAWNYIRGMATFKGGDAKVVEFVRSQAEEILKKVPTNVHALSTIISCCEAVGDVDSLKHAAECCKKLITYDAIRKKYWEYKLQSIVEKI